MTTSQSAPTLTATVQHSGRGYLHHLLVDGAEVARRGSRKRRYTHVLAIDGRDGWTAWSWHLTEKAARAAARSLQPGYAKCVVEVREVTR